MRTTLFATAAAACLLATQGTPAQADARFTQLKAGATLPSAATCRTNVFNSSDAKEIRPANEAANNQTGGSISVKLSPATPAWNTKYADRIKGDLDKPADRSTVTDEALDWAACKWGHDNYILRAMAVQESAWRQTQLGDRTNDASRCQKIGKPAPCYQSYSLVQIKGTIHPGTYPMIEQSVPFATDFASAFLHACYNGAFTWLKNGYRAGDIWGCVGTYYSGSWYDAGAKNYISLIKGHYNKRAWETSTFINNP